MKMWLQFVSLIFTSLLFELSHGRQISGASGYYRNVMLMQNPGCKDKRFSCPKWASKVKILK